MVDVRPQCPRCEAIELRRHARSGFWQKVILARLGYFPWECGQCRRLYFLKLRAFRYNSEEELADGHVIVDHRLIRQAIDAIEARAAGAAQDGGDSSERDHEHGRQREQRDGVDGVPVQGSGRRAAGRAPASGVIEPPVLL